MSEKTPDVKEPLATFKQRAMAGLVPDFLVPVLMIICGSVLIAIASDAFMIVGGVVCQLAAVLIFIATFIFLPYKKRGQSNGKARQKITVKKIVDKEKWKLADLGEGDLGFIIGRAIVNWIEVFFIIPTLVSYIMISSSNNNQTLTDRLFGTVVVQIDPEEYEVKKEGEEEKESNNCSNCGTPYKKGKSFCSKCGSEVTSSKKTTSKKAAPIQEGEANTPALISKFVLLGGSVLPIITFFLSVIFSVLVTVSFSINAWGGFWPFSGALFWQATNGFRIVSYICFFIMTGAIILLALQYTEKASTNLLVSSGLFGGFTIFWIIFYEANWSFVPFLFLNGNLVSITIGGVIVWLLALTTLILSLSFFNNYIKEVNEKHDQNIPKFIGQFVLIPMIVLRLVIFIIGVAATPDLAFGATIYYLNKLFVWVALFTMMGIFIGFIFRAIKFNAKLVPAKS
ncbi:MAG: RDD family protein [Candidatus Heimdallarchaeota archaeon]